MSVTSTRWTPEMKERGIRNVQFVNANLQSIIAMAAPLPVTFEDRLKKAVKTATSRPRAGRPQARGVTSVSPDEKTFERTLATTAKRLGASRRPLAKSGS